MEFALTNSYPLEPDALAQLWHTVADHSGYVVADDAALPGDAGRRYHLRRDGHEVAIALLVAGTVLTFADSARLIRSGVTTVIGCTGYPVFEARHLDEFLSRSGPRSRSTPTLISASSKDYEFRQVIDLLDFLLLLQSPTMLTVSEWLEWFRALYNASMSFVHGEHFAPIQRLLASPLERWAIGAWQAEEPRLAAAIGFRDENADTLRARLADFLQRELRRRMTIRKAIHPDIGSVYHLTIDGQAKQIVLLADGFVINFFARHEKGVKTEFIDLVITLQVLGLVQLLTEAPPPGLHKLR